ncbi:MAG: hypothetical protein ABS46_15405 [Cytophagaceae bacterium SCN 52-12]|nr:MAG: hypothetical protein ABS46_15405 [Cytophagaceae bacterium SCN 52-12]
MKKYLLFTCLALCLSLSSFGQLGKKLDGLISKGNSSQQGSGLSENEIISGLKEALNVGIKNGATQASSLDGFLKNEAIKLMLPPELQRAEATLRKLGLGSEVDKFIVSLNRAAEDAAKESVPIFTSAITSMSVKDALGILNGADTAATSYLKRTTNTGLYDAFFPVVEKTLDKNEATRYYTDLANAYNKVPLVKKINPDLKQYATQKAMDGLYHLIGEEEKKIRKDPVARVTQTLKKVFGG